MTDSADDLADFGALSLDLHRVVASTPAADFRRWALRRLGVRIPFDAAFWACGHFEAGEPVIHDFVLDNRPVEMLADYAGISRDDHLAAKCAARPGAAVVCNAMADDAQSTPQVASYLQKWRIVHAMSSHMVDAISGLSTGIALWRQEESGPFDERSRKFFELCIPHLIEANTANRLHHLGHDVGAGSSRRPAALADRLGILQLVTAEFQQLLVREWPRWHGPRVPEALRDLQCGGFKARYVGSHTVFCATPSGDLCVLRARARCAADALSHREHEIAVLVVQGLTRQAIGERLGIARATVRNHLSTVFLKLGVRKQSELAGKLMAVD